MNIDVRNRGAFSSAMVHLQPGETFCSEAGAMFRTSTNIDVDVSLRKRGVGGVLAGIRRAFAKEKFFFSTYRCRDSRPGEVGLAPTLQGELAVIPCDGSCKWVCTGGSYLASTDGLEIDTEFQGFKGFFTGESISFLTAEGQGQLIVNAFGRVSTVDVDGELTVDTGHVVAFQDTLEYSVTKAGSSWIQSFLSSEGLVLKFSGQGRIYVQSHNPVGFGRTVGPMLPRRRER